MHTRERSGGEGAVRPRLAGKAHTDGPRGHERAVSGPPFSVAAQLASGQQGMVSRRQLRAAGISRHVIDGWVRTGVLHRAHRGVYVVGHLALAPYAPEAAALLACGEDAVISDGSAALLWGLTDERRSTVHVTVTNGRCRAPRGVCIHRRQWKWREVRRRHGLPVTSPARTLIDLAASVTMVDLERLIAQARINRLIRPGELEKALERSAGRRGAARARAVLASEGKSGLTRSEAERMLRRLLRRAALPLPQTNAKVEGYEVDFLWPKERVVVEVDSWQFHGHRAAFERDRRKNLALQAAGYEVLRITATQLAREPFLVIAQIARALARAARA